MFVSAQNGFQQNYVTTIPQRHDVGRHFQPLSAECNLLTINPLSGCSTFKICILYTRPVFKSKSANLFAF